MLSFEEKVKKMVDLSYQGKVTDSTFVDEIKFLVAFHDSLDEEE